MTNYPDRLLSPVAEFTLCPRAVADLESIWDYTVETWGEEQAERYLSLRTGHR